MSTAFLFNSLAFRISEIIIALCFVWGAMHSVAHEITVFGLGQMCRKFDYKNVANAYDVWESLYSTSEMKFARDLQNASKYSKYVTIYRHGTIFVIDMHADSSDSFPLQERDVLLFSKTPIFHESLYRNFSTKKEKIEPYSIYTANAQNLTHICDYLKKYTSTHKEESPTSEYLKFYESIKQISHSNHIRFYNLEQLNVHMQDCNREKSFDPIISCILKAHPDYPKIYEIHLLSPYCVRMIDKNTKTVYCYGFYNNTLIKTNSNLHWYYHIKLSESLYKNSCGMPPELLRALISMELYLGADESITYIQHQNQTIHVNISSLNSRKSAL